MRQAFRRLTLLTVSLSLVLIAGTSISYAQWSWPDSLENMQVLPADWTGQRLAPVMRGFTGALGVRCSHCHVGEEGAPLSTYDFVSDENPNKERAREMLRMLGSINEHLKKIEPSGDQRVNMWCTTCHAGRARPMTIEEEMGEAYRGGGITAALARYDDLRARYYGRNSYDFGENGLNAFGYSILEEDVQGAIRVFHKNTELFPNSSNLWDSLGEAYRASGDDQLAILYYEKALTLDPTARSARQALAELKGTDQ